MMTLTQMLIMEIVWTNIMRKKSLGWLLFVIGWGNNKFTMVIPVPFFLYILGFLGLLSCILFITVTVANHHILVAILHDIVDILVILSAGSIYHQVLLYYSSHSSLKIVLIGVIIFATCKGLSLGIYMFRYKRSTLENDIIIVISLIIAFIGIVAFLVGFGRINIIYHSFHSFKYLPYYIFSVISFLTIFFLIYSCLQSIKVVNSLTCVFLLVSIFFAGGPLTDSFYSLYHHCRYNEEENQSTSSTNTDSTTASFTTNISATSSSSSSTYLSSSLSTIFKIIPGCSYQHQFILAGLLIYIISQAVCYFFHHCYPIFESAVRNYENYKKNFLLNNDVSVSAFRDDPQFSIFKHINKSGWLNSLCKILIGIIIIMAILSLVIVALTPFTFPLLFNTSCVTYTLAGIFYSILLYVVICRQNRFSFIICEILYLFAIVTSGYITNWCLIHRKSLNKESVVLFLSSILFLICIVTVHTITHLYLHHFTNNLQKSLLFMIKLLSLVGLIIFTVGICRQYQSLLSSELIPGIFLMIFGLLSLICWFEYIVIQIVSLNLFNSLFISISLICCGYFMFNNLSDIAISVNHLLKYIGVLIYCIPILVSEIFRSWKGSSYKSSLIKASSRIKLFPIGDPNMYMSSSGVIKNIPPTYINLLVLFKGSKLLCYLGNILITLIISGYVLFVITFIGILKYFNVEYTAHIIFLTAGFINIILLTRWFYSVKHNKTIFRINTVISICSNFSAFNVIQWVLDHREMVEQFNSTSYIFTMMMIGCIIFIVSTILLQMLCFVWNKIELVNFIKSFYLIITCILISSGTIMLLIYTAANWNKLASLKYSIIIIMANILLEISLMLLESFIPWVFLKFISEIFLWCLPLKSGSMIIDVYISLFKCSQSNCKSLPFTIIFGVILIFFGCLLLLFWKIFRSTCSRIRLKYLSENYGLNHLNIEGGYEPYSNIRQNLYIYPIVTISITTLAFAYFMFFYNYESFRETNEIVLKEHLISYTIYSYTNLLSITFLILYMIFELTWFIIFAIFMILSTLFTAGSNINLTILIIYHPLLEHGKLNLVMMVVSIALSTLLYLIIVTLLLKKIGIELDVILHCLRKIKYRCKNVMSYKMSIFNLPNSNGHHSRNKNKRINILNIEEDDDDNDDDDDDKKNGINKKKNSYNNYSTEDEENDNNIKTGNNKNEKDTRFINQFKHRVNDLINVNYMNKKMIKQRKRMAKPKTDYEKLFKIIPIIIYGFSILLLFIGLLIGYKGNFSKFLFDDCIYLESESYTPPHFHWILFFIEIGSYAFITIEYLCVNFQFFKSLSLLLSLLTYYFGGIICFSFLRLRILSPTELKSNPHYSTEFNTTLMNISGLLTLIGYLISLICIFLFFLLKFINWMAFSSSEHHSSLNKKRKIKICCSIDINDSLK
eukprot:jgi/Orpsp1_1/1177264/evm.model.c7180000060726.2